MHNKKILTILVRNYEEIFSISDNELGLFLELKTEINLTDNKLLKCKAYSICTSIWTRPSIYGTTITKMGKK